MMLMIIEINGVFGYVTFVIRFDKLSVLMIYK